MALVLEAWSSGIQDVNEWVKVGGEGSEQTVWSILQWSAGPVCIFPPLPQVSVVLTFLLTLGQTSHAPASGPLYSWRPSMACFLLWVFFRGNLLSEWLLYSTWLAFCLYPTPFSIALSSNIPHTLYLFMFSGLLPLLKSEIHRCRYFVFAVSPGMDIVEWGLEWW